MIYLAYYVSTHHHYGEHGATQHEHLVDADWDQFALIRRVNEHYALPETIRFHRGTKHEIPAFSTKSKPTYCGGGGGTDYTSYVEIRRAPTLVKTHRAREALWYGRRDAQGKFPPDQKFGEWFLITAQQAETYGQRDSYEIEPLPAEVAAQPAPSLPDRCRHPDWCTANGPCANGNCDARGTTTGCAQEPRYVWAWMHKTDDSLIVSAAQKAQALAKGGKAAAAMRPYTIALYKDGSNA